MNLTNLMYVIVLYALFNHELPSGDVARGLGGRCPFLENVQGQVVLALSSLVWLKVSLLIGGGLY